MGDERETAGKTKDKKATTAIGRRLSEGQDRRDERGESGEGDG